MMKFKIIGSGNEGHDELREKPVSSSEDKRILLVKSQPHQSRNVSSKEERTHSSIRENQASLSPKYVSSNKHRSRIKH